jgi:hypothetical protein
MTWRCRFLGHLWLRDCLCTRPKCGEIAGAEHASHDWNRGCLCSRCGQMAPAESGKHVWGENGDCTCVICGGTRHEYDIISWSSGAMGECHFCSDEIDAFAAKVSRRNIIDRVRVR